MKIVNYTLKIQERGFTLIEVLVAMFLLTTGVIGVFVLIHYAVVATGNAQARLVASYLAQEGLEIARNIRDSNFLKIHQGVEGVTWTDGLLCQAGCEADYNDMALNASQGRYLALQGNGFYAYDTQNNLSRFARTFTVTQASADALDITAKVVWDFKGNSCNENEKLEIENCRSVEASTQLYNWLPATP